VSVCVTVYEYIIGWVSVYVRVFLYACLWNCVRHSVCGCVSVSVRPWLYTCEGVWIRVRGIM